MDARVPDQSFDYLDGDGMFLISGDHCLLMPSGLHPKSLEFYLRCLLESGRDSHGANIPKHIERFELLAVANRKVVQKLRTQGVKKIHLDLSQYLETAREDEGERLTITQKVGRAVLENLILSPKKRRQIEEAANVQAKLIISCDRRYPGVQPDDLISVASDVAEDDDDNVVIETLSGQRIRRGQAVLRKPVDLRGDAKTVNFVDAWREMEHYFRELETGGMLEE